MSDPTAKIGIIMGSQSDWKTMRNALAYWFDNMFLGGKSNAPEKGLARVRGVVTLDGSPLANAFVTFEPSMIGEDLTNLSMSTSLSDGRDFRDAPNLFAPQRLSNRTVQKSLAVKHSWNG